MKIKTEKDAPDLIPLKDHDADAYAATPHDYFKKDQPDLDHMLNEVIEKKGDFFCSQPWVHMYMPTYGFQHICCNTSMSVKKHISQAENFEELYNQPEFTKLREEMCGGHKDRERTLKTCVRCIQTEYRGFPSLRESYNKSATRNVQTKDEMNKLVNEVKRTGSGEIGLPEHLHTVELKVWGNYCNLKCIMCSVEDSSSVAEEQMELGEINEQQIKDRVTLRTGFEPPFTPPLIRYEDNYIKEEEYWKIIDRAKRIKLIGGETFLQKQNIQLLEHLVKTGQAKDKELIIFTNNYGYPRMEYVRDLLMNFKSISYKCSMELWGPKNDYIRYPSKWEEVYKNMKMMAKIPQLKVLPTCTLNPITIGYVHEIVQGAREFSDIAPNFSSVSRPKWFTAHCIPDDVVDFYLKRYYNLPYEMMHQCEKAIETLEQREFKKDKYEKMIEHIKRRDKHRGDNILKYFPEWSAHFE